MSKEEDHLLRTKKSEAILIVQQEENECGFVLYRAEFSKFESAYVNYWTLCFLVLCFGFTLIYGVGLLMFPYVFVYRYVLRQEFRRRRLYISSEGVVFKSSQPACCPCLGDNVKEKHVLLPLITDVVVEQNWLESYYGLHSITIENAGQGMGSGNNSTSKGDLKMQGMMEPQLFKKILLRAATVKRNGLAFTEEDVRAIISSTSPLPPSAHHPTDDLSGIPGTSRYQATSTTTSSSSHASPSQQNWDQMNVTMSRIEQLLSLQLQFQQQYLQQPH